MTKKVYSTPEVDVEKFTIYCDFTTSGGGVDGGLIDGDNNGSDVGDGTDF